ncbi:MAG: TRAP transporter permease [Alphaproteobacteria bacterium]|nr:TRAP transporter permease [Alphaproteobacteria bacterium]MCB9930356.1 TRAP transporter permease [Alphaproteobacteria bacterium]
MATHTPGADRRPPYFDLPSWQDEILPFFRQFNLKRLASLVAVAMSLYQLYTGYTGEPVPEFHRPTHLMFALAVLFLDRDRNAVTRLGRLWQYVWDWTMIALLVASCGYLITSVPYIQTRMQFITPLTDLELVLSVALFGVVLEAARRTTGWILVVIVLAFLAFALWGNHLPSPFWHRGKSLAEVMDLMYLTNLGMLGSPLGVTASYIFHFVFFGALLIASGAGRFFTDAADSLTGRYIGGAAKTAVVSSAFMASVSGTAAGNVATTGSFTIPAMKKAGYKPEFAGAVEAVASSGGLMTPPVLGATAFVMAEMTGVAYYQIAVAAILPAILYYIGTFITVDLEARKLGLPAMQEADIPRLRDVLRRQGYLLIPLVTLLWFIIKGYTLVHAAIWSIGTLFLLLFLFDPANRRRCVRVAWEALTGAPRMIGQITVAVTIGGILVGIIVQTGIGVRLSAIILELAGGNLFNILLLTMAFSILLGMGMPATGAYIILALLLAPGMVELGVPMLAAHMFIFYGGCKSNITPPVAIAAFAAAAIAGTGPMRTAFRSFVIGLPIYILPFMFIYSPSLLGIDGYTLGSAWRFITAALGIAAISAACVGWLFRPLTWPERLFAFAVAAVFIFPGAVFDILGFVGLAMLLGWAYSTRQWQSVGGLVARARVSLRYEP